MKNISPEQFGVLFPKQESENHTDPATLELEEFVENNVVEFTQEEEEELMSDFEQLESQGMRGILHIAHQGSPTRDILKRELPDHWKEKYYHRLDVMLSDGPSYASGAVDSPVFNETDTTVYIGKDGNISHENQAVLDEIMQDRVAIISGGGPGSPKDPFFAPLMKAMERELGNDTPGAGICLGHQLFGEILLAQKGIGEGVVPGYLEGTTSVEEVTKRGHENSIFARLGDRFTVLSFNEYHLVIPTPEKDDLPYGKVLTRSAATGYPTSLSLDANSSGQVITTQRHPEFGMKGIDDLILLEDESYELPSGKQVILPAGSHTDLRMMAQYFTKCFDSLSAKFGFDEDDVQQLFNQERMSTHLGVNFYGPLLSYMAKLRLKQ